MGQFFEKSLTARQHILPCRFEIACVPRVGNIAGAVGVVHQEVQLAVRIAAADALHIPQVCAVHADQQIVFVVVPLRKLPRRVTVAGDLMFCQLATRWRINRVADLLPAGCR